MVNTNDFRRYSYEGDAAYALEAFNKTRSSAVPQTKKAPKRKLTLSPRTVKKSRNQLVKEQRAARVKVIETVAVVGLVLAMFTGVLFTYVQKNELSKSISQIQQDISVAKSDNVSLNAQLESLVSVSQIDTYAIDELGMTRLQSNQITYIDTADYMARQAQETQAQEAQARQDDAE